MDVIETYWLGLRPGETCVNLRWVSTVEFKSACFESLLLRHFACYAPNWERFFCCWTGGVAGSQERRKADPQQRRGAALVNRDAMRPWPFLDAAWDQIGGLRLGRENYCRKHRLWFPSGCRKTPVWFPTPTKPLVRFCRTGPPGNQSGHMRQKTSIVCRNGAFGSLGSPVAACLAQGDAFSMASSPPAEALAAIVARASGDGWWRPGAFCGSGGYASESDGCTGA